jgi:hypothetical protein
MSENPCPDCGAEVGTAHDGNCDVARCLWTGRQRLQCDGSLAAKCCRALREAGRDDLAGDLAYYLSLDDPEHDCGDDAWTGEWPGKAECREFGWWSYFGPDHGETGWVQVPAEQVDRLRSFGTNVTEDLNRLAVEAVWDRQAQRYSPRAT